MSVLAAAPALSPHRLKEIADAALVASLSAGALALGWFRDGARTTAAIHAKPSGSPVTEADFAVDAALAAALPRDLGAGLPRAGYVSEETFAAGERETAAPGAPFWLIDPIDGTRAFLSGDPAWALSVALVVAGRPVIALVHAPASRRSFRAIRDGAAHLDDVRLNVAGGAASGGRIAGPRPDVDRFVARLPGLSVAPRIPSLALRLAAVAAGTVEIALASPGSHCWDVAAADLILAESGARLVEADGQPLTYRSLPRRRGSLIAVRADRASALAALLPVATKADA